MDDRGWYIDYNKEMPGPIVSDFKDMKEGEKEKAIEKEKEEVRRLKKLYKQYKDGDIDDKEIWLKVKGL